MRRQLNPGVVGTRTAAFAAIAIVVMSAIALGAQAPAPKPPVEAKPAGVAAPATPPSTLPEITADYAIGPDDILFIKFWKDAEMTQDVVVRPDGKITLPMLNDMQASGLTPEQLRSAIVLAASKFFADPSVSVVVKQINSRKVFVMGEVGKPGPYALTGRITVIQLIAMAGGLNEYAKKDKIAIIRTEGGTQKRFKINYDDIMNGKNLKQNIDIAVGDTLIVP